VTRLRGPAGGGRRGDWRPALGIVSVVLVVALGAVGLRTLIRLLLWTDLRSVQAKGVANPAFAGTSGLLTLFDRTLYDWPAWLGWAVVAGLLLAAGLAARWDLPRQGLRQLGRARFVGLGAVAVVVLLGGRDDTLLTSLLNRLPPLRALAAVAFAAAAALVIVSAAWLARSGPGRRAPAVLAAVGALLASRELAPAGPPPRSAAGGELWHWLTLGELAWLVALPVVTLVGAMAVVIVAERALQAEGPADPEGRP
jgi:hypothetical protein